MAFAPQTMEACGYFLEKDEGHLFEYQFANEFEMFEVRGKRREFPHVVWVTSPWKMDCGYRRALVLKTVAYIVTDEDENGPIIEKWHLKKHQEYSYSRAKSIGEKFLEKLAN